MDRRAGAIGLGYGAVRREKIGQHHNSREKKKKKKQTNKRNIILMLFFSFERLCFPFLLIPALPSCVVPSLCQLCVCVCVFCLLLQNVRLDMVYIMRI